MKDSDYHVNGSTTWMQTTAMVVVAILLVLTAYGDAKIMFAVSGVASVLLFIWLLAERKIWLAAITGVAFFGTVLMTSKVLF